jgi:hypothetical protein
VLSVLVTACGNATAPGTRPPTEAPSASLAATVSPATTEPPGSGGPTSPPTDRYPTPSIESTDRPLQGNGGTTSPSATANVPAGPTLDGRYPNHPPYFFSETPATRCEAFSNDSGGPVTIRDVEIVDQEPAGESVFEIVRIPAPYVASEGGSDVPCGYGSPTYIGDGRCSGVELPSSTWETPVVCAVGVRFTGMTDHTAKLRFSLETRCTGIDRAPCNSTEVVALGPSPDKPVIARWTQSYQFPLRTCLACGGGEPNATSQPDPTSQPDTTSQPDPTSRPEPTSGV